MKSGKEQAMKQRAAGPEKSQDRPTHTELKTLKEDNVTTKAEQQQSTIFIIIKRHRREQLRLRK